MHRQIRRHHGFLCATAALLPLFCCADAAAQSIMQLDQTVIRATSFTIPENVIAVSQAASLTFTGNLVVNGILVGTGGGTGTFTLTAGSITLGPHGSITTTMPGGVPGFTPGPTGANLNIISHANIVNSGLIAASQNINLFAASGVINNNGTIRSDSGSIAFATAAARDLLVDNTGGTVSALLGSITARDSAFSAKQLTSFQGGTFSAQAIDIFGGTGVAKLIADQINAPINITAGDAHIYAETGTVNVASMQLSGDPTIVNNGGDIILNGNNAGNTVLSFPGQNLAVIAAGSILPSPTLTLIDLSSTTGNGGELTLIAGFKVTPAPGASTITDTTTTYKLGAVSGLPARVEIFPANIDTSTSAPGKNGGRVVIAARDQIIGDGSGSVLLGGINTSSASGNAGDVLIQGSSDPIFLGGPINTTAGKVGGEVLILSVDTTANRASFKNGKMTGMIGSKTDLAHPAGVGLLSSIDTTGGTASGDFTISTPGAVLFFPGSSVKANDITVATDDDILLSGNNVLTSVKDITLFTNSAGDIGVAGGSTLTAGGDLLIVANLGAFIDGGGSTFQAKDNIVVATENDVTIGNGSTYHTNVEDIVFLANNGKLTTGTGASFVAEGVLGFLAESGIDIGTGNTLLSGELAATAPATGVLTDDDVVNYGGTVLLANSNININSNIISNGGDLLVAALGPGSNVTLGNGLSFEGHGGYVTMFAGNTITGDGNTFYSRAAGTDTSFSGGLIQISAGFSFNPDLISLGKTAAGNTNEISRARTQILSRATDLVAFAKGDPSGFHSPALDANNFIADTALVGTGVLVNGNGVTPGLVSPEKINGGIIDLSGSTIDIKRGAALFDAVGSSAKVQLTNASFKVESYDLLPTGLFDTLVDDVTAFLDNLDEKGRDVHIPIGEIAGITITPKDALPPIGGALMRAAATSADDDDNSGGNVKHKDLLGHVSMLAHRAAEHKFYSNAVVDTGKTERVINASSAASSVRNAQTISRAEVGQGVVSNLSLAHFQHQWAAQPMIRISERRPDVMLFTTGNQIMNGDMVGSPGSVIVGTEGTAVSASSDGVVLHTGAVVADSGDTPASVVTKAGKVTVAPGTTATVVSAPGDQGVRIIAIADNSRGGGKAVTFTPHDGPEQSFDLKAGEELIIPDRAVQVVARANVTPSSFVATELAGSLPRPSIRLTGARSNYLRMLQRLEDTMQQSNKGGTVKLFGKATANSPAPTRVVASDGSLIHHEGGGVFTMAHGAIFTTSNDPMTIKTDLATIKTKAKAQVSVDANPGAVRIRACSGPGDVSVAVEGHTFELNPGEEILVADERPTKADALGSDGLGRRQLSVEKLTDSCWAVTGDFSIVSMLNGAPYIMPIRHSEDDSSKKLIDDLLKMHASLEYATGARGRYFAQPKETAQNNSSPNLAFKKGGA